MVTLRDIAKSAGVSVGTVSRVINNLDRVKPETREKIQKIIKEVGYEYDQNAARLARRNKGVGRMKSRQPSVKKVEFLFWEKYLSTLSSSTVYSKMMEGAQRYAQKSKCELLVRMIPKNYETEPDSFQLLEKNTEGYFLVGRMPRTIIQNIEKNNISCVHLGSSQIYVTNRTLVKANDFDGGYQAVQHLISQGHKNIGFISSSKSVGAFRKRMEGYIIALVDSKIQANPDYYEYTGLQNIEPEISLDYLMKLQSPPTAVFCASDDIAFKVLKRCQETGIKVPDDLSIIGFDNSSFSEYSNPPLTTVHQYSIETGEVAAIELFNSITNKEYIPRTIVMDTSLIVRKSTAAPR